MCTEAHNTYPHTPTTSIRSYEHTRAHAHTLLFSFVCIVYVVVVCILEIYTHQRTHTLYPLSHTQAHIRARTQSPLLLFVCLLFGGVYAQRRIHTQHTHTQLPARTSRTTHTKHNTHTYTHSHTTQRIEALV